MSSPVALMSQLPCAGLEPMMLWLRVLRANHSAIATRIATNVITRWHLEACKPLYTPKGVEQVMDVTGLPGVIICKASTEYLVQATQT